MHISVFDLFSIGIGPSSSHTVGPMRAAYAFLQDLNRQHATVHRVKIDLYGSLALTGKGHATDIALILGLMGHRPESVDPNGVAAAIAKVREEQTLLLNGTHSIPFRDETDLIFNKQKELPYHPNGMRFEAYGANSELLLESVYYSVGGGFIVNHSQARDDIHLGDEDVQAPFPFHTAKELLDFTESSGFSIAELMRANEVAFRTNEQIDQQLMRIWHTMESCIDQGCRTEGILPGGLNIKRRAAGLYKTLTRDGGQPSHAKVMEWVSLWALAVNEQNAAAGRVVTAPTNGAAGVIPSVINYYRHYTQTPTDEGVKIFLLTAGAIGILYKRGASISAAEMGCMGEVGVACSMAAAGLTATLGGSTAQIENAAEIGMEHNLGLTCDPIKGLVQIPCIERNTMGAVKAINAALLSLQGDGSHFVSLDQVIATMRETGKNMQSIYKETSLGGLAVNVPEC